jgi:hypothetical protein
MWWLQRPDTHLSVLQILAHKTKGAFYTHGGPCARRLRPLPLPIGLYWRFVRMPGAVAAGGAAIAENHC